MLCIVRLAWRVLHDGVSLEDAEAVGALAYACTISFRHEQGEPVPRRVFVDGVEVTGVIRTAEIDRPFLLFLLFLPYARRWLISAPHWLGGQLRGGRPRYWN